MKRRPIYRRVSFWLGLFVACSLQWLWWDSLWHLTGTGMQGADWAMGILQMKGESLVMWGPERFDRSTDKVWFNRYEIVPSHWERNIAEDVRDGDPIVRMMVVPDAMVFAAWMILWGGWMVWRWGRERREERRVP
ncbi:hypothetical protein [Luteolibacter soli]|uniref:DUF3592 domain-containing protein n=1 Tax=Luteolibacter soli TaxID=3135280 RepID=A0ABU9AV20_9BACT